MATVVVVTIEKIEIDTDEQAIVEVVDGQQRLTTLIILLNAVALKLGENDSHFSSLKSLLVRGPESELVLVSSQGYNIYLRNYLLDGKVPRGRRPSNIPDKNIIDAIHECRQFVECWSESTDSSLYSLLSILKNKLHFVYYELSQQRDVYTVFEVLNSRGLPVSWVDRCKAMLMGAVFERKDHPESTIETLKNIWARIYKGAGLNPAILTESLRFAATLRNGGIQGKLRSSEQSVEAFQKEVERDPDLSIEISTFIEGILEILNNLYNIKDLAAVRRISHARLLFVAINLKFSGGRKKRLIEQWERTTFRIYGLADKDTRTRVGHYIRVAEEIFNRGETEAAARLGLVSIKEIAGKEFAVETVVEKLRNTNCYSDWAAELRYFLYKYEEHLVKDKSGHLNQTISKRIWNDEPLHSIEHILPQNPKDGGEFSNVKSKEDENYDTLVHRLGNLVLCPSILNQQASNSEFSRKKEFYGAEGLAMLKEITSEDRWTRTQIQDREERLVSWAKRRWADLPEL